MAPKSLALALASALAATTVLAAPAQAAALSSAAPAAVASPPPAFDASRFDPANASADWRCRGWRCRNWGHRGWRRDRVDAGDVLIGAAIIGGIAAIASSNNRRARDRDVVVVERDGDWRDNDRRFDDRRTDDRRTDRRDTGSSGLDSAVDQCLTRIERDVRVDSVDGVERTGRGWMVSGALFNGSSFQCRIGNDGRIESVDFGDGSGWGGASLDRATPRADGQWSDDRYAAARLTAGGMAQPSTSVSQATARLPAYPGGPLPGEEIPESIPEAVDADIGG